MSGTKGQIEGHITIIADFGTLRTQASIRCATQPAKSHRGVSGTKGQIEGHSTITAGFGTLRTQASVRFALRLRYAPLLSLLNLTVE